jgi:hypothetical protein
VLRGGDRDVAILDDGVQLEVAAESFDIALDGRELGLLGALDSRNVLLGGA